ncbi:TonB-dependent receptor [Methylorubrum salsuginis]|uniref:Iron complex outermembrane recepter protein n=1 Tax=Methylorubrum salsuginis TaxID=414703 RepID=A0A1I4JG84_9HYPH|nr:TonB-dependent receptor [Methylorubrum salsuginis]SFL65582.1 iron complex outermembrane recepter protein [Methylorubrum salsuginis]
MRMLRSALLVSVALLPGVGHAQQQVTLDEISVVATTPVGAGTASPPATPANGPALPLPSPAEPRLRGGAQPLYKIPSTVESVTAADLETDRATGNVVTTLARRTPGLNISDAQGNSNRVDINYRGFTASPVQGVPQGLAVYQNGVRINEAFGDIVQFDLIPPSAIQRIDVVTGNPVFGLNALGGAINVQMKNGFTWQGTEVTALGGSDGRIAGGLQHGQISGPFSFYFNGDGLNDRGWRYESPSTIGRIYTDLGYRAQDSEFHVIGAFARTFFGAASAAPVDFTHVDPRAIFTFPQTTTTQMGTLQVTGRVDLSPTWDLSGNAYFRRFSNSYVDGNDGNFEECGPDSTTPGALCFERDGFADTIAQDQFRIRGRNGQLIPYRDGVPYGTIDITRTEAAGYGGSLQAANRDRLFGLTNSFVIGGSIDVADYAFKSSSALAVINPNLLVTTNPGNSFYGAVPGLGTDFLRTEGALGIAPSSVIGSNLYMGLYATDTLDLTDSLALTAGARLNFARVTTRDLTGFSPDVNGTHYFTKINPIAGLTYRFLPELSLFGSYSESNRAPTPLELACANPERPCLLPNSLVADPPLKQVTARTYEAGIRGAVAGVYDGALTYKLSAFRTDLSDDIIQLATPGNAARGYYVNVPATRRQGIEVGAEYSRGDLSLYANYALIDATFQFSGTLSSPNNPLAGEDGAIAVRPGNKVPLIPDHQFKVGFDYLLLPGWKVGLNLQAYSSAYYRGDESNLNRKLPSYYVLGLNTSYRVNDSLELFGLVTNLTNNRYATFGTFVEGGLVANRYPINDPRTTTLAQPLSVYGGLRYTFNAPPPAPPVEPLVRKN